MLVLMVVAGPTNMLRRVELVFFLLFVVVRWWWLESRTRWILRAVVLGISLKRGGGLWLCDRSGRTVRVRVHNCICDRRCLDVGNLLGRGSMLLLN